MSEQALRLAEEHKAQNQRQDNNAGGKGRSDKELGQKQCLLPHSPGRLSKQNTDVCDDEQDGGKPRKVMTCSTRWTAGI